MTDTTRAELDLGAYTSSLRETLRMAPVARFHPINGEEVVTMKAQQFDELIAQLKRLGALIQALTEAHASAN